ncbi:hypothetical protein [Dielma fastidiosa]|uniref:hypothetical protein n=1 Tax=Dielma fastidiosa TaxID=1034346 RepID=UPI000E4C4943|nr:hypothetical protein [Dielma fastidiosa]RHM97178.1 hypothetical protein DWZ33_16610 [Dielma fastidiosa]
MEKYFPFDGQLVEGKSDRTYYSDDFANYFKPLISNGIFAGQGDGLMVLSLDDNMFISIAEGYSYIEGRGYQNDNKDGIKKMRVANSDIAQDRIDIVVNRLNKITRMITTIIIQGELSDTPTPPEIVRNDDYYDLKLAEIYVRSGVDKIQQADITDTRFDDAVCGWVTGLIESIDATAFFKQYQIAYDAFVQQTYARAEDLFNDIRNLLDTDQATYLLGLINELKTYPKIEPYVLKAEKWLETENGYAYTIYDSRYSFQGAYWELIAEPDMDKAEQKLLTNARISSIDDKQDGKIVIKASGIKPIDDIHISIKIERLNYVAG